MAQHTAPIGRIDFDGICDGGKHESGAGEIISDNRLHVAVGHAAPGRERK
jgi:hypothetical protein